MKRKCTGIDILYWIGILIFVSGIIFLVLYRIIDIRGFLLFKTPDCFIETLTGLFCPGCGMTRAVIALTEGKILKSAFYNAIVLYALCAYVFLMGKQTAHYLFNKKPVTERILLNLIYAGAALIVVQWVVKVVLLLVFGIKTL